MNTSRARRPHRVVTLTIPEEENAIRAPDVAEIARQHHISAEMADPWKGC